MIPVTKTFLPPQSEYNELLNQIWERRWITNHGPMVQELEQKLNSYLGTNDLIYTANGTLAIQIALKALKLKGEIITTPFSYVATTGAILWENYKPVFADIEPDKLTIDPEKIEAVITEKTTGILATHVFGNPCDIEAIEAIAEKHRLKVIYDAAHAFGVEYKGQSLYNYGDLSIASFHATKLFHTVEGGAVFNNMDASMSDTLFLLRSFGHKGDEHFINGINAKNSEFHAAMGLCMLGSVKDIVEIRKNLSTIYDALLKDAPVTKQVMREGLKYNYAYYPVLFNTEEALLKVKASLNQKNIYPRRYFYPSLNTLPYLTSKQACAVSENVASRVLCLPLYHDLKEEEVEMISKIIDQCL